MDKASDFLDDTCKMKLLTTFNEQVKKTIDKLSSTTSSSNEASNVLLSYLR